MCCDQEMDNTSHCDAIKKVFVGGIGQDMTDCHLREYFSRYGIVQTASVMTDKLTGNSRGFGFVVFESADDVNQLCSKCLCMSHYTCFLSNSDNSSCSTSCCVALIVKYFAKLSGTGIRGLMRGMTTLPQGDQELLVVRDKVGRPPGELGVSKSMECGIFSLQCLRHCWLGDRKGIRPVKRLDVGLLVVMI